MTAYYNELDPFAAAAWLRELIKAGLIAPGDVDERSIEDVRPDELRGYTQCHFFAGIGGWSYALRLAGWPDSRPVWSGSCPCQPFSAAGKQQGTKDDRHLWPEFFRLIRESRPDTVFGEQVANAIGHDWLDHVSADLEGEGYAVGSIVLGAHSVGAPHIRQRLWFVADADGRNSGAERKQCGGEQRQQPQDGCAGELADASSKRQQNPGSAPCNEGPHGRRAKGNHEFAGDGENGVALGDTQQPGLEGLARHGSDRHEPGRDGAHTLGPDPETGATRGFWHPADWLPCRDRKARPVEPGTFPLAHGVSARVGRLRGYGNAIIPQVAAEVIRSYIELDLAR